jgi:hypothetical protein
MQFGEVRTKVVDAAKRRRDRAQRTNRVRVELGKPMLEALELRTQDELVGPTILRELPQLRLGDEPLRIRQHDANLFLQGGVELEPGFRHRGRAA